MNGKLGQYGAEKRKCKRNEDAKKFGRAGNGVLRAPSLNRRGWAEGLPIYDSLLVIKRMRNCLSKRGKVLAHGIGGPLVWVEGCSSRKPRSVSTTIDV